MSTNKKTIGKISGLKRKIINGEVIPRFRIVAKRGVEELVFSVHRLRRAVSGKRGKPRVEFALEAPHDWVLTCERLPDEE